MKKIKYLSYYAETENPQNRNIALAATNKIDYICDAIIHAGYEVNIISASGTRDRKKCYRGSRIKLKEGKYLKTFFSFPWGNKLQKGLNIIASNIGVLNELLKTKKDEKVIVYHSLGYMRLINLIHKLKRFHLVLEVEEIYADVIGNENLRKKEIKFLSSAESYIFPTKLLDSLINVKNKPAVVIHGTYQVESERECRNKTNNLQNEMGRIIHCVYAGTFDPRKGGAIAAAAAAEYLPSNYHIHILGFGNEKDVKNIKQTIDKIAKKSCAKLTYDGMLSGEEYIRFIQSCDIGLSTQEPTAAFNATSFPSKILSYLANGLRVVSIRIPAIENSDIGKTLYYYNEQSPEQIAKAILKININDTYDSRELIRRLSEKFEKNIKWLLE